MKSSPAVDDKKAKNSARSRDSKGAVPDALPIDQEEPFKDITQIMET
jgi:hypothetical protein